jgi:hypothetical protein
MAWEICIKQSWKVSYHVNRGPINMLKPTHTLLLLELHHNFQHDKNETPGSRISQKYLATLMCYHGKPNKNLVSD